MYDPSSPLLRPVVSAEGIPNPEGKTRFAEDRLLDAVIWCDLAPSETVTEGDVMDRFGLTKAAARSGLARLGYDGWATPQPRTGWLILPVSGALIGHVIDARRNVEPALSNLKLSTAALEELDQIAPILEALEGRSDTGVLRSVTHYLNRVDSILLEASNPLTARHLRKLWHHTARITHYFDRATTGQPFRRTDGPKLIKGLCARDNSAIQDARSDLITAQELYFMRQLLRDDTPLTSLTGGGTNQTIPVNRREL